MHPSTRKIEYFIRFCIRLCIKIQLLAIKLIAFNFRRQDHKKYIYPPPESQISKKKKKTTSKPFR